MERKNPLSICVVSGTLISILIAMILQPDIVTAFRTADSVIGTFIIFLFQVISFVIFGMFAALALGGIYSFLETQYCCEGNKSGNIWTLLIAAAAAAITLLMI